jgi:1-acyl-sn-glycerol-3-phosphate acyltransferase
MVLIFLRSLVFNILFYVVFAAWAVVALPTFLMPRSAMLKVASWWARTNIFLMRVICGIRVEFRGVEKIPKGPLIVASKHQSMWETISLLRFFEAPFFVLKRELLFIPLFGFFLIKTRMIAIDRAKGGRALLAVMRRAAEEVRLGRQFVIFPEGTRTAPGAPPQYARCGIPRSDPAGPEARRVFDADRERHRGRHQPHRCRRASRAEGIVRRDSGEITLRCRR